MVPYTLAVAAYCSPFRCGDCDLDEFFSRDSFLYEREMLGKTYAWINTSDPTKILGLVTLANDSVKTRLIAGPALNRLQRNITHAKRGINYPAVLIGRLGVSEEYRGKGLNIGSQILEFLKGWFRSSDNKTGCRFIVVDAYNNDSTLRFYEKNGFKLLYKTDVEERDFLGLQSDKSLGTRFMYFDLKVK
ncbi:MAG: GNAT family N-acetyltransferase [Duncaniella sp.]|nr:GNAT family N-acetyltransferase [Duncaniella sp.]